MMTASTTYARPEPWPFIARKPTSARSRSAADGTDFNSQIATLYDLFADDVFGHALWLLGSRDEAAEVVQDAFVRVL